MNKHGNHNTSRRSHVSQYSYQIYRRTSSTSLAIKQDQDTPFTITTKSSELSTTDMKSTKLVFLFNEVYEGALLKGRLTSNNLSPDTDYTFELFVVEQGPP